MVVKALVAQNLDEAVAVLSGSEFFEKASKAQGAYKEKGDLRLFDIYLDHVFFKTLDKAMKSEAQNPDIKRVVSVDIDAYNVLAVLRGKYWGLSTDRYKRPDRDYDSGGYQRNSAKDDEYGKISEAAAELSDRYIERLFLKRF